jgi:regulator of vacuolar morphogenesis
MTLHLKITNTSTDPTNTYTLYHLSVYQVVSNDDRLLNKNVIKKRYSDFINLKEQLEARFKCKIPYEFPERKENFHSVNGKSNSLLSLGYIRNILPQDSLNKDVVRYRRKQLELFLNDLISDPYDDKWRKCIVTRIFFNHCYDHISEGVDVSHMFDDETKLSDIYMDQKGASSNNKDWWYLYRRIDDILTNMDDSDEAREKNLKEIINVRLLLQKLESGIMDTDSVLDRKKRQKEFKGLKYKVSERSNALSQPIKENEEDNMKKNLLFKKINSDSNKKYDVVKPTPGRRLGSKRQVLQSQKDDLKSQEESLESLRETVVKQKLLSLAINEELLSQNELLSSLETDVDKSGAKIQKAHDKTEKYNNL